MTTLKASECATATTDSTPTRVYGYDIVLKVWAVTSSFRALFAKPKNEIVQIKDTAAHISSKQ